MPKNKFKIAIRTTIKQVRSKMSQTYKSTTAGQICTRILNLEQYKQANRIAIYHAVKGEVDLTPLWHHALNHEKMVYFPVIKEDASLIFLPTNKTTILKQNEYGIPEPDISHDFALHPSELDIVFIPLVAFDARCNRIGMGAGYYDRTFAKIQHSKLYGVAYQFQRVDFIDPQPWDVPLDAVITNRAIYWREARL